ncbi:MAG: polyphosphate polymerase domain-containing protein [Pseudomonadota bacterium]
MNGCEDIIKKFKPITLEEIDSIKASVKLLKRHDTKFIFSTKKLFSLMESLLPHYRILEMNNKRFFKYENLYFDTEDCIFYQQHHNRKFNRYKLRYRKYVDLNSHFWEIKFKTNKRKTIKKRFEQSFNITELTDNIKDITRNVLPKNFGIDLDLIKPSLWIFFSRFTLANTDLMERITIDVEITYRNIAGHEKDLKGIAVAELKQAKFSLSSPFVREAKKNKIYIKPFSKYCTGIALMENPAKINRFKRSILNLEKLSGTQLPRKGNIA